MCLMQGSQPNDLFMLLLLAFPPRERGRIRQPKQDKKRRSNPYWSDRSNDY